jgi:hypothetical protein
MEAAARNWCENGYDLVIPIEELKEIKKNHYDNLSRGGGKECATTCIT